VKRWLEDPQHLRALHLWAMIFWSLPVVWLAPGTAVYVNSRTRH
jgi:hypothetical protein